MEEIVGSGIEDPGAFELSYNFPNTGTIYYEQFISPSTGTYTDFKFFCDETGNTPTIIYSSFSNRYL